MVEEGQEEEEEEDDDNVEDEEEDSVEEVVVLVGTRSVGAIRLPLPFEAPPFERATNV